MLLFQGLRFLTRDFRITSLETLQPISARVKIVQFFLSGAAILTNGVADPFGRDRKTEICKVQDSGGEIGFFLFG